MEMMKRIVLFCLVAATFITCKKETLQPGNSTGSPVFYFNGIVNGSPVSLSAGVNNYYMYSSYTTDANNVYNYTASLHQVSCSNCTNSIQFVINDYKSCAPNAEIHIADSSLIVANYPYVSPTGGVTSSYKVAFRPYTQDSVTFHHWNFGDGDTSGWKMITPVHTYKRPGNYVVTLTVGDSCSSSITNSVSMGTPNSIITAKIIVTKDSSGGLIYLKDSITGGTAPYNYVWNFGDFSTAARATDTVSHKFLSPGNYQITATTTDSKGLTVSTTLDTNTYGSSTKCIANFSSSIAPNPNTLALSNINVIYTDGSGNTYSSANVAQPTASAFQVTQVSSYQNNQNNQTTKMLHIKFNCLLKGTAGTITITNGDAVIAVAYK